MNTKRPEALNGRTIRIKAACGTIYLTLNDIDGVPTECFIRIGKGGGCAAAQCEAIARLLAWGLRSKADLSEVVLQLKGIGCHEAQVSEKKFSCPHAIGMAIEKYLEKGVKDGQV